MSESSATVVERLKASLESASAHNPNDAEKPVAVLWTDRDAQWRPTLARLRALMPQLLVLGEYEPESRTGPSIWLRCVVDRVLELPGLGSDSTPVIYLPDVSRQALGSAETCPSGLKPLVELQYRGTCWTQKNGRDWTVEAFMVSSDGGLGLDVARDAATRQSMLSALPELATTLIRLLEGRRLEANDFDALFSDDPVRDLLLWLSDPESTLAGWEPGRRSAFASRCKSGFGFDPNKDGALVAAERLGLREGAWGSVWSRFAESPALYPGLPELLHQAMPHDLFVEQPSSWPLNNEKGEEELRRALVALEGKAPFAAREEVLELEITHGPRREWVWAKLDQAPLANALMHLAEVAERTSREFGGVSPAEMAAQYAAGAWKTDAAALSSFAEVSSAADATAVSRALNAIYRPWLDAAARHLQALADRKPLPRHGEQDKDDVRVGSGAVILFADGLRLDVSRRLSERLKSKGRAVATSTRWAAHPTVTATAKPAVSPVSEYLAGASLGAEFQLVATDNQDRFTMAGGKTPLPTVAGGKAPLPLGEGFGVRERRASAYRRDSSTTAPHPRPLSQRERGEDRPARQREARQRGTAPADGGRLLHTDRFRKLLDASGYQYLSADETEGPSPPSLLPGGEGGTSGSRLDGVWRPRQARPLAASEVGSAYRRAGRPAARTHRVPPRCRLARGPCRHRPRLALASRWTPQGGPAEVPDPEPLGTLRLHRGRLHGPGADRSLVLECGGTGRRRPGNRLLRRRQRVRAWRLEPAGESDTCTASHGGRGFRLGGCEHHRGDLGRTAVPRPNPSRSTRAVRRLADARQRPRLERQ